MRALLGEHLRWADGGGVEVLDCAVGYSRQAGGRVLLHYDVVVRDPETGSEQREMITGIATDPRKSAHLWDEAAQQEAPPGPGRFVPSVRVSDRVSGLELLLQVFPFDYRLPALARLMNEPASIAAPYVATPSGHGGAELAWHAKTVRYRVGMRAMVRLTAGAELSAGEAESIQTIYAKVFRDERDGERTYEIQRAIWEETVAGNAAFTVAEPLAWLPDDRVLLYAEVPGVTLRAILASGEPAEAAVRQAACAIASFHLLPIAAFARNPRRRPTRDEEARPEKLGARLRASAPELAGEIDRLVAGIETGLSEGTLAPTHFDLRPGHVLIDGERAALLDFDKLTLADPMVDIANFLRLLEKDWKSTRTPAGQEPPLDEIFADEYFARVPAEWAARLPAHYALALLAQAEETSRARERGEGKTKRGVSSAELIERALVALAGSTG
jgi:hypothetical protein